MFYLFDRFKKRNEFLKQADQNLKALDVDRPMHNIESLCLSPKSHRIICVTRRAQLFWAPVTTVHESLVRPRVIKYLILLG